MKKNDEKSPRPTRDTKPQVAHVGTDRGVYGSDDHSGYGRGVHKENGVTDVPKPSKPKP